MARLNTMFMESKVSQAMYKLSGKDLKSQTIGASASTGGSLAPVEKKPPQVQQKWEDLKKQLCEQIAEVLTSDQFAALKRFAREQAVARLARKVPFYEGTKVGVSDVQKEKLRQLNNARSDAEHQLFNSVKENTLNAMPPELRQKCFEAEERRGWWW
jgi:predicted component of type VI protein secretion system